MAVHPAELADRRPGRGHRHRARLAPYDASGKFRPIPPEGATLIDQAAAIALSLVTLALLIPWLAVQVRRFHDSNRSAWHLLWKQETSAMESRGVSRLNSRRQHL